MKLRVTILAGVLAVIVALGVSNLQSVWAGTFPGQNGKIAFVSFRDGNGEIYSMNSTGSGQTNLSNNAAYDLEPNWSSDGAKIAFSSDRDGNTEIYAMNADGSSQTRLTNNSATDSDPSWSLDGKKIAFVSDRDGNNEIYAMNANGIGIPARLTNNNASEFQPTWSPDGKKIAFVSDRDGNPEIYSMNSDGSGQTNLSNNAAFDGDPTWSPDGSKIAFVTNRNGNFQIYSMNSADGSGQTNLSNNAAIDILPDWGTASKVVGGEILSIDLTSLFVAGSTAATLWIVPMLVAIATVAIVFALLRKGNGFLRKGFALSVMVALVLPSALLLQSFKAASAELDLGPYIVIGPPNDSVAQDADSNGLTEFLAYQAPESGNFSAGVYLGRLDPGEVGGDIAIDQIKRAESQGGTPALLVPGGTQPSIDVDGNHIVVVTEQSGDIVEVDCTDNQTNCSVPLSVINPFIVTSSSVKAAVCAPSSPQVATSGNNTYFVWTDCGDVMFRARLGGIYGNILNLSSSAAASNPLIALTDLGTVHVTFEDSKSGNTDVYYQRSDDHGASFNGGVPVLDPVGNPENLSNTPGESLDHTLATSGLNVAVAWVDYTNGNGAINFKASNDDGLSFGDTKNLSLGRPNYSWQAFRSPDIAMRGTYIALVFSVCPNSLDTLCEVMFRESTNGGLSFGSQVIVSKTPNDDSKDPQVGYTPEQGDRYVAWLDKGGPPRIFEASGTFGVLASESEDGHSFTSPVNLSDNSINPHLGVDQRLLEVVFDVATWDPSGGRG